MISSQLLDELHKLNRVDKLRVIQALVEDLAAEESAYFRPGTTYEIWSPYDAPEAASTLMNLLEEDHAQNG